MDAHAVAHPADRTLQAYGLGRLDDASAESVAAHLERCPTCRRRVAELSPDRFIDRLGETMAPSASLAAVISAAEGMSMLDRVAAGPSPLSIGAVPPDLAGHPDYEVIRELGRGGMGVVYLARNTLMGRMEVLKVVGGDLIRRPQVADRFLREIRAAARLYHPNIVTAYSALRLGDCLVLAMEYIDGLDLARLVKTKGPLPVADSCNHVHQAALGLQHAHEHSMVHRDIKPANLILSHKEGKTIVKVLDFGLAKASEGQVDTSLTRDGQMLGTPDYIAPEQIRDAQSADIRADIYSLGCTFYYLLSGGPPFGGANLWDLYQAHLSMDAAPLSSVRPGVPVELAALVAKMMAKEPADRFQTPGDVARALTRFLRDGSPGAAGTKPDASAAVPVSPAAEPTRPVAARAPVTAPTPPPTPPPLTTKPAPPVPVRQAAAKAPAPPPLPTKPAPPASPATILEGLIDLRETGSRHDRSSKTLRPPVAPGAIRRDGRTGSRAIGTRSRFGPWAWWAAAALFSLGLVAIWAAAQTEPAGRHGDGPDDHEHPRHEVRADPGR